MLQNVRLTALYSHKSSNFSLKWVFLFWLKLFVHHGGRVCFIMKDGYASGASCESHDSSSANEEKTLKKIKTSTNIKKWNEGTRRSWLTFWKKDLHFGICLIVNTRNACLPTIIPWQGYCKVLVSAFFLSISGFHPGLSGAFHHLPEPLELWNLSMLLLPCLKKKWQHGIEIECFVCYMRSNECYSLARSCVTLQHVVFVYSGL